MSSISENPPHGKPVEDRARALAASGLPTSAIADLLDVTVGTVDAWLRNAELSTVGNPHGGAADAVPSKRTATATFSIRGHANDEQNRRTTAPGPDRQLPPYAGAHDCREPAGDHYPTCRTTRDVPRHGRTEAKEMSYILPLCGHPEHRPYIATLYREEVLQDGQLIGWYDKQDTFTVDPPKEWARKYGRHKGEIWFFHANGLRVCVDYSTKPDGLAWVHVSFSRVDKLPTYDDMCLVKRDMIGTDRWAIQYLPAEENHVNIHQYCLHLWYCPDKNVVPDFSGGGGSI